MIKDFIKIALCTCLVYPWFTFLGFIKGCGLGFPLLMTLSLLSVLVVVAAVIFIMTYEKTTRSGDV